MAHKFEHLKIPLEAIKSATNNFADESCIGRGGFGRVYKGKIGGSDGQTMVALKRLDPRSGQGFIEFWKEVMLLSQYRHNNIVSLLGFCDEGGEKILVYEYVPNQSLDRYISSDNLRWIQRLKICIGAAHGLAYLHNANGAQQRVLHRDIKSANILLDENWNAKISDFGLSKLGPANQEYTFLYSYPAGTPGYVDPLYVETGLLTKESDVYSFGVVLFEVLCGRFCIDNKNINRPPLIELVRQSYEQNTINEIVYVNIKDEIDPYSLQAFAKIAYQCLKRDRDDRPLMSDIVGALKIALQHQELYQISNAYLPPEASMVLESSRGNVSHPVSTQEYASSNGGFLVVTIHEGFDLKGGKHRSIGLRVGFDVKTTKTMKNTHNLVWNETFRFTIEKPSKAILHLVATIDHLPGPKEAMGDLDISVADVVKETHMNNIYNIAGGRLHVELQWEGSALPVKANPKALQFMSFFWNWLTTPYTVKSRNFYNGSSPS